MISKQYNEILKGKLVGYNEALSIVNKTPLKLLLELANNIRKYYHGNSFELCSITNASSGNCTENCKWCAQSKYNNANISTYEMIDIPTTVKHVVKLEKMGVQYHSLVTSGKKINQSKLEQIIKIYNEIAKEGKMKFCASLGLISKEQLEQLREVGVKNYHCNLETSKSFFHRLCSTHTYNDKVETIKNAQKAGLNVCSGGIIGMGESMNERINLALELRELGVFSIPVNILSPIKGTPLEKIAKINEEEVLKSLAIIRIINPKAKIRFAGGRSAIKHIQSLALKAGVNAAITGDLLTTTGSDTREDIENFKKAGFNIIN